METIVAHLIDALPLLCPYNNHEDGVSDSNLFIQLTSDINLQCLYTMNLCSIK